MKTFDGPSSRHSEDHFSRTVAPITEPVGQSQSLILACFLPYDAPRPGNAPRPQWHDLLALNKCEKVSVEAILFGNEESMRRAFIHFELATGNRLRGPPTRQVNRGALVCIPVDDQSWHREGVHVLAQVRLRHGTNHIGHRFRRSLKEQSDRPLNHLL